MLGLCKSNEYPIILIKIGTNYILYFGKLKKRNNFRIVDLKKTTVFKDVLKINKKLLAALSQKILFRHEHLVLCKRLIFYYLYHIGWNRWMASSFYYQLLSEIVSIKTGGKHDSAADVTFLNWDALSLPYNSQPLVFIHSVRQSGRNILNSYLRTNGNISLILWNLCFKIHYMIASEVTT